VTGVQTCALPIYRAVAAVGDLRSLLPAISRLHLLDDEAPGANDLNLAISA
jgi:hypothetical protein